MNPLTLAATSPLVHVNAGLNLAATILLIAGYVLIKQGKEQAHKAAMLMAFVVSSAFLVCYLYYHFVLVGHVKFTAEGPVRYVYYTILASHVLLAMTVPFLAVTAIVYGHLALSATGSDDQETERRRLRYRRFHRRTAQVAFPVWLYVSVTGVVVYLMLYHLWPPA